MCKELYYNLKISTIVLLNTKLSQSCVSDSIQYLTGTHLIIEFESEYSLDCRYHPRLHTVGLRNDTQVLLHLACRGGLSTARSFSACIFFYV